MAFFGNRLQRPRRRKRQCQAVAGITKLIGKYVRARFDLDLVAGLELQEVTERLAVGNPVSGYREIADLPGFGAFGTPTDSFGKGGVIESLDQGDFVVVAEPFNSHEPDRIAIDVIAPVLFQLALDLVVLLFRDDVRAVVLPAHVAEKAQPDQHHTPSDQGHWADTTARPASLGCSHGHGASSCSRLICLRPTLTRSRGPALGNVSRAIFGQP